MGESSTEFPLRHFPLASSLLPPRSSLCHAIGPATMFIAARRIRPIPAPLTKTIHYAIAFINGGKKNSVKRRKGGSVEIGVVESNNRLFLSRGVKDIGKKGEKRERKEIG